MANVAVRALTRGDRSPSPAPSRATVASSAGSDCGAAITTAASMDRRRLTMVLEQSITLILEQALLSLTDPRFVLNLLRCSVKLTLHSFRICRIGSRDKQLLRRELGSELSSFTESLRRHSSFAARNRSTSINAAAESAPLAGASAMGEENYIKFVSSVVHHVFK